MKNYIVHWKKLLIVVYVLSLFISCASQFVNSAYNANDKMAVLWEVTDDADNRAYILGSIHVALEDLYPLPTAVMESLESADYMITEIGDALLQIDAQSLNPLSNIEPFVSEGNRIIDVLSPQDYANIKKAFTPLLQNVDTRFSEQFENSNPQYISLFSQILILWQSIQQSSLNPAYAVDNFFSEYAESHDMPLYALESIEEQMNVLYHSDDMNSVMDNLQELSEKGWETLANEATQELIDLYAAYSEYDIPQLYRILQQARIDAASTNFYTRIIDKRNEIMADSIMQYMRDNAGATGFVVIGAAHVVGGNSILAFLDNAGYSVRPIQVS